MDNIGQQDRVKEYTEEQLRREEDFSTFSIPDETKLDTGGGSEKDNSDHNMITDDKMCTRIAGSQEPDNAALNEHQPPKMSETKRLRADKTRSTKKPAVNNRHLLKKFVRQTRLINQMKAAKGLLETKMKTETQKELPPFRPTTSLDRIRFVVKSLKRLIAREETRRQSCWKKFMMDLESLNDVVIQEIRKLRIGKTRGLPDKDVGPGGPEQEEPAFEDICLYCDNDECSGCD
jgi:hypothetical protein